MISYERDTDGVVTLTMDDPESSANTMNERYAQAMAETVERLYSEREQLTGVVVTSAKKTFFAGGNLDMLRNVGPEQAAEFFDHVQRGKALLRRLETLGKPVVAALNGSALGGGMEIGLACHHRIAVAGQRDKFGFPEVTLGLLPGAGGVTRTVRMLGIADALMKLLLQGTQYSPEDAQQIGLIDELVSSREDLLPAAKAWIREHPEAAQPWDQQGFKIPGGTPSSPKFAANLPAFPANLRKQLKGAPMPAPKNIMAAAVEGSQVDIDTALRIESRYLTELVTGQTAKNMIQAFFFDLGHINAGGSRPDGIPTRHAETVAVLGAGMMGAGIAYVCARNGAEVLLKDVSVEAAEKGKQYSRELLDKQLGKGKITEAKRDEVLARITPASDPAQLSGADVVIEAVFESSEVKHQVFSEAEPVVAGDALLCSNTSTLPITGLAEGVRRQSDFIGLHFFSPVDKMPLVEIIRGEQTSDEALARAFDLVQQIKKTPIVVGDSRGFFTSRVIGTFLNEAVAMLGEGVPAASIEQASNQAGYPAPALQLFDELTLTLPRKIRDESKAAVEAEGGTWHPHPGEAVLDAMVERHDRKGRAAGAGFYDYDAETGKRTGLWAGLSEHFGNPDVDPGQLDLAELADRMLIIEVLETVRCFSEGVLTSVPDANIGSIMGIGFPPWTGGVVGYIAGYEGRGGTGVDGFLTRCKELAGTHGARFQPPSELTDATRRQQLLGF